MHESVLTFAEVLHEQDAQVHGGYGAYGFGGVRPGMSHFNGHGWRRVVLQVLNQHLNIIFIFCLFSFKLPAKAHSELRRRGASYPCYS